MGKRSTTAIVKLAPRVSLDVHSKEVMGDGLRVFVGGESGSGKSRTIALLLEQLIGHGKQVIVLDLHGEYAPLWEVRPGGTRSVVCIGYGEAAVEEHSADMCMERVREGHSLCIDLSHWADVEPDKLDEFIRAFTKELLDYRRKHPQQTFLVLEEAASVVPQAERTGQADTIRLFTSIVTGGRKFGLYIILASQRTSLVNHNIIAGCNVRLFLRSSEDKDWRKVVSHYAPKTMTVREFQSMKSGTAVLSSRWFPSQKVNIHPSKTMLVNRLNIDAEMELALETLS